MDILVMNRRFQSIDIIDAYESLIWTDRYCGYGDFELYMPVIPQHLETLVAGNYLYIKHSDRRMIVEDISITTDAEEGNHLTVTGRSLESILERRVIDGQLILEGTVPSIIQQLLNHTIISPTNSKRKIPGFTFESQVTSDETLSVQYFGDNLYDAIVELCSAFDYGFAVYATDDGGFKFVLYSGVDRTGDAPGVPMVMFSPKMDNFLNSNYIYTSSGLADTAYISGHAEEDADRPIVSIDNNSGLDRREIFVDANDVDKTYRDEEGVLQEVPEEEYTEQLLQKGREELATRLNTYAFEGEVEAVRQFIFGRDFFIGDLVYVENEYGFSDVSRISEVVISHDIEGEHILPTFTSINETE